VHPPAPVTTTEYEPAQRLLIVCVVIPPGDQEYVKGPLPVVIAIADPLQFPLQLTLVTMVLAVTAFTVTLSVCALLLPHALFAVTEIVPPADPAVALMLVVVDVPLHPPGKVHV
jgi:hypothetical protein